MWVQRDGRPGRPLILFEYEASRGQGVAARLLVGFRGTLRADGFEAYGAIAAKCPNVRLIGCFARARRKFHEARSA